MSTYWECPTCHQVSEQSGNSYSPYVERHAPLCKEVQRLQAQLSDVNGRIDELAGRLVNLGLIPEFRP